MRTYKAGDSVTVIGVTPYNSFVGCEGVIVCEGEFHDWLVDVTFPDGNHDKLGYDEYELTPTTPPAPATAAGVVGDVRPYGEIAAELYGGRFNEGWIAASRSVLDILERTLENAPAGYRLAAIEKFIEDMRVDYPKHG